ncbi:hypothetical protein JL722_1062 [Aureococcus anophagefferens]|nr:hypothetical protein JL722_1062 [Aureococcus anophagefferens]
MATAQASSDAAAMAAAPLIASDIGIGSVEIDASDVVRLVLQFLKEHGLSSSAAELERESGVLVNAVEAKGRLVGDVRSGRWDAVLPALASVELPAEAAAAVHEHACYELCDAGEGDVARELLRHKTLQKLRGAEPERFLRLERAVGRAAATGGYGGEAPWPGRGASARGGRGRRRRRRRRRRAGPPREFVGYGPALAGALRRPARLRRPPSASSGDARRRSLKSEERPPKRAAGAVRLGAGSKPLCCAFAPDGSALITGSSDGFVELWDPASCRLRTDLPYQRDDELLMHDAPVLALAPSLDGTALASGDRDGCLKVWRLATGQCAQVPQGAAAGRGAGRKQAETSGKRPREEPSKSGTSHPFPAQVSAVAWSRDGSQLLTASSDGAVRSHGLKSGRTLQQFRGHGGSVSAVAYLRSSGEASDAVVSGSADGTVRVWDPRSAETVSTFSPPKALATLERRAVADKERAVVAVLQQPGSESKFFVVDKSPTAVLADLRTGVAVAAFSSRDEPAKPPSEAARSGSPAATVAAALSRPRGDASPRRGQGPAASTSERRARPRCPIDDAKDVVGLAVHPHRNVVASFGDGDKLLLWKS